MRIYWNLLFPMSPFFLTFSIQTTGGQKMTLQPLLPSPSSLFTPDPLASKSGMSGGWRSTSTWVLYRMQGEGAGELYNAFIVNKPAHEVSLEDIRTHFPLKLSPFHFRFLSKNMGLGSEGAWLDWREEDRPVPSEDSVVRALVSPVSSI
eukprot:GILI01032915.1.p1 GENE.GILI01032915.1~~GILI01032915.1.p1  ORF type:complete len:149 (+),score=17.20 GILI01032915.1:87-533(+)